VNDVHVNLYLRIFRLYISLITTTDGEVAVLLNTYEMRGKVLLVFSIYYRLTAIAMLKVAMLYRYKSEIRSWQDFDTELKQNLDA